MPLPPDAIPITDVRPRGLPKDAVPVGQPGQGPRRQDPLARNIPVQFGRGVQDVVESIPYGPEVENFVGRFSPLLNLGRLIPPVRRAGEQFGRDVQSAPDASGMLPNIARISGNIGGYSAAAAPVIMAAEAAPAIPAVAGIASKLPGLAKLIGAANSPLGRTAAGIGGFEAGKKVLEGKPMEAPGEFAKGASATFVGGKAFQAAGKGIQAGIGSISKGPAVIVNSLIKPLLKDFSYGKNPGKAVAEEGIVASSLDDLAIKIGDARQRYGKRISGWLDQLNFKRGSIVGVTAPLDDAMAQAQKSPRTNAALIERLQAAKDDLLGIVRNDNGQIIKQRNLTKLSPREIFDFKSQVGDITKFTGNASDDALVNKALKRTYGQVKEALNKMVPKLSDENERYANLLAAEIATKYRDKIASRQNMLSLSRKVLGGGAAIAGLATGNPKLIAAAVVELAAEGLLSSPAVKTKVAAALAKIPAAEYAKMLEQNPTLKKIPGLAARTVGATLSSQEKPRKKTESR